MGERKDVLPSPFVVRLSSKKQVVSVHQHLSITIQKLKADS
jgi:hypothetical protein